MRQTDDLHHREYTDVNEKPATTSDEQWAWHQLCQEHGEQEAKRIVCGWLRTMADEIENERYPEVFSAERKDIGVMIVLNVTTSFPWGG